MIRKLSPYDPRPWYANANQTHSRPHAKTESSTHRRSRRGYGGILLFGIALALGASASLAETFVVDTEDDGMFTGCNDLVIGDCTLRGAIEKANLSPGSDTIHFGFSVTTIELTLEGPEEDLNQTGDLDVLDQVAIIGNGTTTIDAGLIGDRVFDVSIDSEHTVLLQDLVIKGGRAPDGDLFFNGGGARCLDGTLFLNSVQVRNNGPVRNGGGVYAECRLVLNFSTIGYNSATNGGGGVHLFAAEMTAPLSAIISNHAGHHGGGLSVGTFSTATLDNMTLSGNTAVNEGSAIQIEGTLSLDYVTLVADPLSPVSALTSLNGTGAIHLTNTLLVGSCEPGLPGSWSSGGGNLESPGDSCGLDPSVDQTNVTDAKLLPLGNYGGATPSHMPQADSPAVDDPMGATTSCPSYDQRLGPNRPQDGNGDGFFACDIGAIERDILFSDGFESGDTTAW